MAITVTSRGGFSTGASATLASSAFTPANASAIVAIGFMWDTNASGSRLTFSDSFADTGGGTWQQIAANDQNVGGFAATLSMRAYYRVIGTSPGSHTVTANGNASAPDNIVFVLAEVAGGYNPNPIPTGQKVTPSNTGAGTITNDLPNTPDAASVVFSAVASVAGSATGGTPTGYTNLYASAPFGDALNVNYDIATPGDPTTYTGLQTAYPNLGLAFEFAATPSTPVPGFTISDNFGDVGGGVWTRLTGITATGAEVAIWARRIGTGPVSGTVTATAAQTTQGRSLSVLELANRNATDPVPSGQSNSVAGTAASLTDSLPATPITDSIMVAGALSRGDASPPGVPAGHTSLTNVSTGGDGYEASYVPGNGIQTVAYTGLATTGNLAAYAEIRKAGSGGGGGGGSGGGSGGGGSGGLFVATSTWNTPIPANATYTTEPALNTGGYFETGAYTIPVYRSSASDPVVRVQPIGDQATYGYSWGWPNPYYDVHIPLGVTGAPGQDGSLAIIDIDGNEYDFWQFKRDSNTTAHCQSAAWTSTVTGTGWSLDGVKGAGIHAVGSSLTAGLLMGNELTQGINHTVVVSARGDLVKPYGYWTGQAINSDGWGSASSPLTEGERYGIPPNVAMPSSGLTTQQQTLWKACQKYGCFLVDVNGDTPPVSISFWGDLNSIPTADVNGMNVSGYPVSGLTTIVAALRIVH